MSKLNSRKFYLAVGTISLASIFLFIDKLGGGEWVTIVTLSLAMYKTANIMEGKHE